MEIQIVMLPSPINLHNKALENHKNMEIQIKLVTHKRCKI